MDRRIGPEGRVLEFMSGPGFAAFAGGGRFVAVALIGLIPVGRPCVEFPMVIL